ncbi:hypothetical protein Tco_0194883 [Tanacetum coccineum]
MLTLRDLPHKISQTVNEVFKEAVQIALQALLPLYEALEVSMDRDNKDEFLEATTKSRKRCRDDQYPPPPPPDSDKGKKKKHDSKTSAPHQPQAHMSSAWKTTNTRDAPLSSSKQKTTSQSEQPIEDILIPDDEERSETPEPDWAVPLNDLCEPDNNLANAIAKSYKDPEENKLLQRTGDIGSFIKWYYRQIGKLKLSKADLEGPANKIDLVNPEGNQIVPDMSKPLPLGGPPGQTKLNLKEPSWDATNFLFKEDSTIVSKPRVVIYRDRNNQKKMTREIEYNPGMENRIWSEDDKRRSKEFMEVIERRLKIKRIFRNLESFMSRRLRDVDYRLI